MSQLYCFGKMGESLTRRIREASFEAIIQQVKLVVVVMAGYSKLIKISLNGQDMFFFDDEMNSIGVLLSKLSKVFSS